jgi:thiamine-monophosphate kinase
MNKDTFRTIASIGRIDLIEELMEGSTVHKDSVLRGSGDDTAVLEKDDSHVSLLTSESFMEGVDFDLTYTPLHHLGYKVAASAISDIYAMNGTAEVLLVNLALPNKLSVDMVRQIYEGIYACGDEHDFQVVGGDLTASHQYLAIGVTAWGTGKKDQITYRSGAQNDEALCLTGDLGGALAGLRILMREKSIWEEYGEEQFQPDLGDYEYVVRRQLVPKARRDFIQVVNEHDLVPSSMIDVTQGLVNELKQLAQASNTGMYIYQAALPIAIETRQVADEMKEDVDKYALYGGEDLELLFTLPEKQVEKLSNIFGDFTVIGKVSSDFEGIQMQTAEGDVIRFDDETA